MLQTILRRHYFCQTHRPSASRQWQTSLLDWSEEIRPLNRTGMYKQDFDLYEDTLTNNMRHQWPFYFIRPSVAKVWRQAMGKVQAPHK